MDQDDFPYISVKDELLMIWDSKLKDKGVKKPGGAFLSALCFLYINSGKSVSIDEIKKYVTDDGFVLGGGDSLQVRHLAKQFGFNMYKGGEVYKGHKLKRSHYLLADILSPHPSYIREKRNVELTEESWIKIKNEYKCRCACCGDKEGEPARWNEYEVVTLQKGHMDPRLTLREDNCIPQCKECNQQYKDKAVFNLRGKVILYNEKGLSACLQSEHTPC